jgi:hypothetical protein
MWPRRQRCWRAASGRAREPGMAAARGPRLRCADAGCGFSVRCSQRTLTDLRRCGVAA